MTTHKLTIAFEAPLHHGSGFGISGLIDRAILRDTAGFPYLAGSAIKGKLRHAALRVLLSRDEPACHTADAKAICAGSKPCRLCLLFGSPRRQGAAIFGDAGIAGHHEGLMGALATLPHPAGIFRDSMVRARTAIDRKMGTARPGLLFSTEVLPGSLVFESAIHLNADDANREASLKLLREACRVVTHFGADGARGLGRCSLSLGTPAENEAAH